MKRRDTADALLKAAEAEFNARGFNGTDTNRIARRAGFAPQTFYRHFTDKTAIFLAVYERWWRSESAAIAAILEARGGLSRVADTLIAFHVKWRGFRRSLRHLAVEDERVRAARRVARKAQIASARRLLPKARRGDAEILAALLVLERLCDAIAEDEFEGLGIGAAAARRTVIAALEKLEAR
ncbi:MAG TPA: helix-turn-helix domain-containing protein [Rhizomicrobium sp.]|jgi:AcrR family transcriptional regulator